MFQNISRRPDSRDYPFNPLMESSTMYDRLLTEISDSFSLYQLASQQGDNIGVTRHLNDVMFKIQSYVETAEPYDKEDPEEGGEANVWAERMMVLERLRVSVEDLFVIWAKLQADTELIAILLQKEAELNNAKAEGGV